MDALITKWGNSLALRIPKAYADKANLKEGSAVELVPDAQGLRVRRRPPTLAQLLEGVSADNLHGETLTGGKQGREEW